MSITDGLRSRRIELMLEQLSEQIEQLKNELHFKAGGEDVRRNLRAMRAVIFEAEFSGVDVIDNKSFEPFEKYEAMFPLAAHFLRSVLETEMQLAHRDSVAASVEKWLNSPRSTSSF